MEHGVSCYEISVFPEVAGRQECMFNEALGLTGQISFHLIEQQRVPSCITLPRAFTELDNVMQQRTLDLPFGVHDGQSARARKYLVELRPRNRAAERMNTVTRPLGVSV